METDKEKITRLENRISELHSKNAALRHENEALKRQIGINPDGWPIPIVADDSVPEGEIQFWSVAPDGKVRIDKIVNVQ